MKKITAITVAALSLSSVSAQSLEERVETLEYANYANFFNWSGTLENRVELANKEDKTNNVTGNSTYIWSQVFLDMNSQPTDKLSFNGRLSMRKYWNNGAFDGGSQIHADAGNSNNTSASDTGMPDGTGLFTTWSNGRTNSNGQVYVERAYINYSLIDNLTFSIGRLPTIDGMPKHMSSGDAQLGTYPVLAFSAILDGAALTHSAKIMGGTLATRFIYTPLQYVNYGFNGNTTTGAAPYNTKDDDGVRVSTNDPMWSLMLDYNKQTSFAQNMNLLFQLVKIDDAFFGATGENTAADGSTVVTSSSSTLRVATTTLTLYAEFRRIMNTGLTLSLTWGQAETESEGGLTSLGLIPYCANNAGTCKEDGSRYIIAARYDWSKAGFGVEYIDNGEASFTYDTASRSTLNVYGTGASQTVHLFANYNFDNNFKIIAGYEMQEIEKTYINSIFGAGTDADIERDAFYTRFIATF